MDVCALLEKHYRDVQDVEFTIEHGTLYLLQTRSGKRTGQAAVKIAVDMVREKLITKDEALLRAEPAVVGAESLGIDEETRQLTAGDVVVHQGDVITIDGSTGEIMLGEVPVIEPSLAGEIEELLRWADEVRTLGVRANADYPRDARKALEFGAEGIGLCRTEHMFMETERLPIMQQMIMAATEGERRSGGAPAARFLEGALLWKLVRGGGPR